MMSHPGPAPSASRPGDGLLEQLADCLRQHLPGRRGPLLLGVSGGADSVALLRLVHALHRDGRAPRPLVAHFDHALRPDSAQDAAFVARLCQRLGVELLSERCAVPAEPGLGPEAAARKQRRRFLERQAAERGVLAVTLAHTRDDQAETLLLRLARGSGPAGLAAMRVWAPPCYLRPLLGVGREQLRDWLRGLGQDWREDPSNRDLRLARNRVRRQVLPELARLNPRAGEAIARAARLQAEDQQLLEHYAARELERCRHPAGGLDCARLLALPAAMARRVVRCWLAEERPAELTGVSALHLAAALALAAEEAAPAASDLPGGLRLERHRGSLRLGRSAPAPDWEQPLQVPGSTTCPEPGWTLSAHIAEPDGLSASGHLVHLDARFAGQPLSIRNRRPGDRFEPLGGPGRRPLGRYLRDRGLPRALRDRLPLVCSGGQLLWVVGEQIASLAAVPADATRVLELSLEPA